MKSLSILIVGGIASCFAANSAVGAVLYSTTFSSPTYSDAALIGQDSWAITGTSVVNPVNVSGTATDGVVPLTTTGQDVRRTYTTAVSPTDTSIYYSVNVNVSAAQATGDYFIHLSDGGTTLFYSRLYARSATGGYQLAIATSSGAPTFGTSVLSFNTEYQIVAKYELVSGTANDVVSLYVNPTSNIEGSNTVYGGANTIGTDATAITSFTSVNLRQGAAANAPTVAVDDIRVATTFAEAAAIPEPTTLLGIVGLAGMTLLRRRANRA